MRVVVTYGTRPEAIKMAPVLRALRNASNIEPVALSSGQHKELLDPLEGLLELQCDRNLCLMAPGQSVAQFASRAIESYAGALAEIQPDLVLVHGDTSTAFAAALASFYSGIEVGHVEAGLRTWDMKAPWPEEANRRLISPIAQFNFAPTESAAHNLESENIPTDSIYVTGNTVVDSLLWTAAKIEHSELGSKFRLRFAPITSREKLVLITNHRRENFGTRIHRTYETIRNIAREHPEADFVFPMHFNPEARKPALEVLADSQNVHLIEPLDYPEFIYLMSRANLIITDSGGIQEEAPTFGIPILVTRDVTERPEAVEAGAVKLVGSDYDLLFEESRRILKSDGRSRSDKEVDNPYGDGRAAERIAKIISNDGNLE